MLDIYHLIPYQVLNLDLGSGDRCSCWRSTSSSLSPSESHCFLCLDTAIALVLATTLALFRPVDREVCRVASDLCTRSLSPRPKLTISAYLPNPIYHQIAFAFILLSSTGRLLFLTHKLPASSQKHKLINTFLAGIATFAGGFAIWNIDNIFCDQLRTIRDFLGPILGMVAQGHGYWHLMTGYGSYLIFTSAICRSFLNTSTVRC